ncbi:MAG: hypothetical protein DCC53_09625 [Chloroflexi bacterium]|nr:MAG: hypothetical protein DCC53_09625 [Chloroflexota bacterium]
MVAQSSERIAQMTLEEFLNRPDTNLPMEYEDGEVIMLPMPTTRHQRISRKLTRVIEDMISSGEVFFAPLDVKLGGRVYQPDVFWVKAGSACVDRGSHFDGPPDLVVEIASPSTSSGTACSAPRTRSPRRRSARTSRSAARSSSQNSAAGHPHIHPNPP